MCVRAHLALPPFFLFCKGGKHLRIAICDDEKKSWQQLITALHGWDPAHRPECFSDGASLLQAAQEKEYFDIVFLDIYMPGENGVDIAGELQRLSPKTGIVFVTTSREHAVDAFSLHALHYLVKPVTTEGVAEAFRRLTQLKSRQRPAITLTAGRDSHTVYLDEIYYVQSVNHAAEVFLTRGRQIKVWTPLNELKSKLGEHFLKINRGTVVNMEQIEQMGIDFCMLRDGTVLGFSRRERRSVRAAYDDYLFSRLLERRGFDGEAGR